MKKTLSILLSIISLTLMAQVPQGVGYQGVATDANGIELVNQAISIRASVLSGSANGTIEWQETHATSTDTFGLFTLTIGQGTNTTTGLQTSFADISWGTNTYFLKIEMDVTGGSTYSNMGTNQMMSVPYALYAESANINYDSISNFLSGDSTFLTNVGGGMGGGGCDLQFPDGLDGEAITETISASLSYTVPSGKRLYLLMFENCTAVINGKDLSGSISTGEVIILNAGDILTGNCSNPYNFNGYLVDEVTAVIAITETISASLSYTVPSGKKLYLLMFENCTAVINGKDLSGSISDGEVIILNAGDILTGNCSNPYNFNGYLADENYFANCGGGGSSNSTTNTTIDSIIKQNINVSLGPGFSGTYSSDTISVDYFSGRSINIGGWFSSNGGNESTLYVVDENFNPIPSHLYKVSGFGSEPGSSNQHARYITEINEIMPISGNSPYYFSKEIELYNLTTTKIYIFLIGVCPGTGSCDSNGDINIQY